MKKNAFLFIVAVAVAAAQSGVVASSSAQTVAISGSSALFLETGLAASLPTASGGLGLTCIWSESWAGTESSPSTVYETDTHGTGQPEYGNAWIAWTPVSGSCSSTTTPATIYAYLSTDSVVGNRCLFNGCTFSVTAANGAASANKIAPPQGEVPIITAVINAVSGDVATAGATDIRPEDALFATKRALAPCGAAFEGQYDGLGYANPSQVKSWYSGVLFNIGSFSLPSTYTVYEAGAAPIIVTVNDITGTGFAANPSISNITSGTLAEILDGTLSETQDISGVTNANESITVVEREPVSGTYNTMEYNVPNTQANKTSQDVGENQQSFERNCSGSGATGTLNPMDIATADQVEGTGTAAGVRTRAIGTGEMLNVLFGGTVAGATNTPPGANGLLGYAFWSVGNFKGAYSGTYTHARYLTVDGIDPFFTGYGAYTLPAGVTGVAPCSTATPGVCPAGTIPTPTNKGITAVTMPNVQNGSYPIWSFLRLVCLAPSSNGCSAAKSLASASQTILVFGANATSSAPPDFIPVSLPSSATYYSFNSTAVRSHFMPPGIGNPCAPVSNGVTGESAECGGDVGGVVYSQVGDLDYAVDVEASPTGFNGNRR